MLILQSSCLHTSNAGDPQALHDSSTEPTPVATPTAESIDLGPPDKQVIYTSALQIVHAELVARNIVPAFGEEQVVFYKRTTIPPRNLDSLDSMSKVSPTVLANFVRANQKGEELDDYPLKQPVLPMADSSEVLEDFYNTAKRKDGRTYAVVALSNVGVDYQLSDALVYVEVYSESAKLAKFYLVLKMSKVAPGYYKNTFNGVDSFELIPVE